MRIIAFAGMLAVLVSSCAKVPVTNRRQIKLLPESMVMSLSLQAFNDIVSQSQMVPSSDSRSVTLNRVGTNMEAAVVSFMNETGNSKRLNGYKWEYRLIESSTVNAFCMPGGKIAFYSGILPYTLDETGIAVVMGHEMAHAVARHGNERLSQQLVVMMGGISLAVALNEKPQETRELFLALYGVSSTLGTLAYSRQHEYEADKLGMIFMARAGYDPSGSIDFWERMAVQNKGVHMPAFLSTHPSDEKRIAAMKEFLPEAKKYYKK